MTILYFSRGHLDHWLCRTLVCVCVCACALPMLRHSHSIIGKVYPHQSYPGNAYTQYRLHGEDAFISSPRGVIGTENFLKVYIICIMGLFGGLWQFL